MTEYLLKLYQSNQTVFSTKEVSLLFPEIPYVNIKSRLNFAVKNNKMLSPRNGYVAKPGYNIFELANKLYSPSYISLQTVLKLEGMIFQEFNPVYLISYLSRKIIVDGVELVYKKIPEEIINNPNGIVNTGTYFIASKERAFLDTVYLYGNFHFDNLSGMDWDKVSEYVGMYKNKTLEKLVKSYYIENNESIDI